MNHNIKKLTVRITCKGLIGTGFIYWPHDNLEDCYVITAKHCILGDQFSNGAIATDVTVDKIYKDGLDWASYTLTSPEELSYPQNPDLDIAVIKLKKNIVAPTDSQFPEIKFIELADERIACYFKGYPFLKKNQEARTMDGIIDGRDSLDGFFHLKSTDNFVHYLKVTPIIQVKGLSGSGVCLTIDDDIYFYGIVNKYEAASHRFLGTGVELFRKEFFPSATRHHYEVERFISARWFKHQLLRSSNKLGPRFDWKSNYEVAIQSDLDNYGRTEIHKEDFTKRFKVVDSSYQAYQRWYRSHRRTLILRYGDYIIDHTRHKVPEGLTLKEALLEIEKVYQSFSNQFYKFDLNGNASIPQKWLSESVRKVITACFAAINGLNDKATDTNPVLEKKESDQLNNGAFNLHQLITDINLFQQRNLSHRKLINSRALLVRGPAGNGKSQLLAFAANKRNDSGYPSVLVLGQRLTGSGDPWGQILKELELRCTKDEFLTALNRKAELAEKFAIIFIDALNEGYGLTLWPVNFEEFLSDAKRYPWLKIVMSYRTSFKQSLFRNVSVAGIPDIEHTGFDGYQRSAMEFFFKAFGISPKITSAALIENFKNPLFLKLFCIAYASGSFKGEVDSSIGLFWIIDRFLAHVNERLGSKENFDFYFNRINLVKKSVDAFVITAIENGTKGIGYEDAFLLTEKEVSRFLNKKGFINGLINEEVYYENAGGINGEEVFIDFSYERFGDHLKMAFLLKGLDERQLRDSFLKNGKLFSYFGTKQLTENNKGLFEALQMQVKENYGKDIFELAPTIPGFKGSKRSYILNLVNEEKQVITSDLLDFVNEELNSDSTLLFEFWDRILPLAYDPKTFFNADFLNSMLSKYSMAERDALWTIYLQNQLLFNNQFSSISSPLLLAEDALKLDDAQVFLLAECITWFLVSTNRRLRDHSTKTLINLLYSRTEVLIKLHENFKDVNDPYVSQRLYAVIYGCIVRTKNANKLISIAKEVYNHIFLTEYVKPDVLLRDYARSTIEYAVFKTGATDFDPQRFRPKYKSPPFESFPSNEEIDSMISKDHSKWNATGEFGLSHILSSMVTEYGRGISKYGDFGRYVFGSAVSRWPDVDENGLSNLAVKMIVEKYGYNIATHGKFDSGDYHPRSERGDGKLERIGKKYQWIALHEILAVLSDNYRFASRYSDESAHDYQGPWEPFVRDIDPTLIKPPLPNDPLRWKGLDNWEILSKAINNWAPIGGRKPDITPFIEIVDDSSNHWLVLQGSSLWDEEITENTYNVKEVWTQIRSYIVDIEEYDKILSWAEKQDFMGRWMPESSSGYEVFNREFYWAPSAKDIYDGEAFTSHVNNGRTGRFVASVEVTATEYNWDTSNDNSRERNTSMLKPSRKIMDLLGLEYDSSTDGILTNAKGKVIAFDPSFTNAMPACLVIEKKSLLDVLKKNKLAIFWTILGERGNSVKYRNNNPDPRISFSGTVSLKSNKLNFTLRKAQEEDQE